MGSCGNGLKKDVPSVVGSRTVRGLGEVISGRSFPHIVQCVEATARTCDLSVHRRQALPLALCRSPPSKSCGDNPVYADFASLACRVVWRRPATSSREPVLVRVVAFGYKQAWHTQTSTSNFIGMGDVGDGCGWSSNGDVHGPHAFL
jgi:hypothetical protein